MPGMMNMNKNNAVEKAEKGTFFEVSWETSQIL